MAVQLDTGEICFARHTEQAAQLSFTRQMDFIRAAALSNGGKPIIAIPSTAAKGALSRIIIELKPGSGVVTTRGHVHWVVTEYEAVNLHGMTLRERGQALISIAHPDFRAELRSALHEIRHFVIG